MSRIIPIIGSCFTITGITPWIEYFVKIILDAQTEAEEQIDFTLKKVKFFDRFRDQLNERQLTVIKECWMRGLGALKGE